MKKFITDCTGLSDSENAALSVVFVKLVIYNIVREYNIYIYIYILVSLSLEGGERGEEVAFFSLNLKWGGAIN